MTKIQMHHNFRAEQALGIKHFFNDRKVYDELLDCYNRVTYRFEFKSLGRGNNGLKTLDRNGFDYELMEDLNGIYG